MGGSHMIRHPWVATRADSLLLVIDFQQGMLKAIPDWEEVEVRAGQLLRAARILDIPLLVTEQYPKGLGQTQASLLEIMANPHVFPKEHFSACLEPDFLPTVQSYAKKTIVVTGTETHVCVLQTCLDLIQAGFQVHVAADAVASRVRLNRELALQQLGQAGAVITSAEIVIFEWACRANTGDFRRILPVVKM